MFCLSKVAIHCVSALPFLFLPLFVPECCRSDFIPYEVTRRPGKQQAEYQPNSGNIDLDTTYKQDFSPYQVQPVAPVRPKERVRNSNGKLDTMPTYKGNNISVAAINKNYSRIDCRLLLAQYFQPVSDLWEKCECYFPIGLDINNFYVKI